MPEKISANPVQLLPAFDEYIIGYADRTAALATEHQRRLVTRNGIFFPAVVANGKVCGLWKRSVEKKSVVIKVELFSRPSASMLGKLEKKVAALGKFLDMPAVMQTVQK